MQSLFASLLPTSQVRGVFAERGRAVPVDPRGEPRQRPRYPRYVAPFEAAVADATHSAQRQRPPTPPEMRAEAAAYRARAAVARCAAREARRGLRPA